MVGRDALREYVRGSLWVLPTLSVLAALAAEAQSVLQAVATRRPHPYPPGGGPDEPPGPA